MTRKSELTITNEDNMALMSRYPDNHFELAIVDPPYGIDFAKTYTNRTKKDRMGLRHESKEWDDGVPNDDFFIELQRVSKNQIIWGGNYFPYLWKNGCKGFIFWHKGNPVPNFSDGELAWTSFNKVARQFDYRYYGALEGNTSTENKIHPTQKPVSLYEFLLMNYAEEGDKILDTHLGSGSIAIACNNMGYDLTACELDKDYFEKTMKRIDQRISQIRLF